jgi:phosphoglucomutase
MSESAEFHISHHTIMEIRSGNHYHAIENPHPQLHSEDIRGVCQTWVIRCHPAAACRSAKSLFQLTYFKRTGRTMPSERRPGHPAPEDTLIDVNALTQAYYEITPEADNPRQQVSFGTSGHRGTSTQGAFNEAHILAITQAICDYRQQAGITGPLFMGKDTHALSSVAQQSALEVLLANQVETVIQRGDGATPTPVISRHILAHNAQTRQPQADGIVITPSHNPPEDGGFKYNPPHGGPAGSEITTWIQDRANQLLATATSSIQRVNVDQNDTHPSLTCVDLVKLYVDELQQVIDFDVIRSSGVSVGVDPLGGASAAYWDPIREKYGINLTVVNDRVDPQFGFMTLDHDGKIRMDCSSPYAMANLVRLKDSYDVSFGNDPDADRHGIVTRSVGIMNPNHFLAVAIRYLFSERADWSPNLAVGKTLVSSGIIDRVVESMGRTLCEVPVGFKWFVEGLASGRFGFAGEESAGASFLKRDGGPWSTDKDGLILGLLAAEITARSGRDPGEHFREIAQQFGEPCYRRIDQPATPQEKDVLKNLSPDAVADATLAGEPIQAKLTRAPGNDAPIGGLKVVTQNGWFAARPSGTENIYKIYAESFRDEDHLSQLIDEAAAIVGRVLK